MSLDELFDRDPKTLSDSEKKDIIDKMIALRTQWVAEQNTARSTGKKADWRNKGASRKAFDDLPESLKNIKIEL